MRHRVKDKAIFALLDGRLEPAARSALEAHLGECAECRAFHRAVGMGRETLAALDRRPAPEVDWRRVDAALFERVEAERGGRRGLPAPALFGALAAVAIAAFVLAVGLARRGGEAGPEPEATPSGPEKAVALRDGPGPAERPAVAAPEPFVTFVAGRAELGTARGEWRPLALESALGAGSRLRTDEAGAAGIQVGAGSGCRIEPGTDVALASVEADRVRLEVSEGQVSCACEDGSYPIVVSVIDVVASAVGSARFAVQRDGPQVVVIELAEGTLELARLGRTVEVSGPARVRLAEGEEPTVEPGGLDEARLAGVTAEAAGLLPRRSIASLHLPELEGIERAEVDGVGYGPLPLHLRRTPGLATIRLYPTGGAQPFVHEVTVALGPTTLEPELVLAALSPRSPELAERRVGPRIGTMDEGQIRRLRSIVGGQVRTCYERTLKRYPNVWGRIQVSFTVSTTGEAKRVGVTSVAGGHQDVNDCVLAALSAQRFPPPRGGMVPVEQTITLAPRF